MKYSENIMKSPIRAILEQSNEITIFETGEMDQKIDELGVRGLAEDIKKSLEHIEDGNEKSLRIAIVGELKAGKSTLINALLETQVAYTDVTEATAVISEITYCEQQKIQIQWKNGQSKEIDSFDTLIDWMQDNCENREGMDEVEKVRIGLPKQSLKNLVLVDTPGLLTITEENESTTKNYLYQADYIMWIMNSNNLGDSDVNDAISRVASYGKPMLGVINKVDNEDELESIQDYVYDIYDGIFEEIFFTSAKNGWKSRNGKDDDQREESGIPYVLEYLESIGEKSDVNKERSNNDVVIYQLKREYDFHKKLLISLEQRKQQYDYDLNILKTIRTKSKESVREELEYWMNHTLFRAEREELLNCEREEFEEKLKQYSSDEYVSKMIQHKCNEIEMHVYNEWRTVQTYVVPVAEIQQKKSKFITSKEVEYVEMETDIKGGTSQYEAAEEGGKLGAKLGILMAGYSAWLGPGAASISIGAALLNWVPALAVGGFVVSKYMASKTAPVFQRIAISKDEKVTRLQEQIVKYLKNEVGYQIRRDLEDVVEQCYKKQLECITSMVEQLHFSYDEPQYSEFIAACNAYMEEIEEKYKELEENNQIIFTETDYL